MRLLRKGRPQTGWSQKYKCTGYGNGNGGCGAKLLVEQADLFYTASHHYDGSSEHYVTFQCSECGVSTDIDDYPGPWRYLPSRQTWLKRHAIGTIPGLKLPLKREPYSGSDCSYITDADGKTICRISPDTCEKTHGAVVAFPDKVACLIVQAVNAWRDNSGTRS